MIKDLILKIIKRPDLIWKKIKFIYCIQVRRVVPFTHKDVADLGKSCARQLPYFSSRLYKEVKLLNEAVGSYHAKRALEIGCGYGRLTPWIAEHCDQLYSVDREDDLLKDAMKLYPKVHFYHTNIRKLPFPDSYFDLCISWTVLQHIVPKEFTKAVTEVKRVCTPKAIIVLCEDVGETKGRTFWQHTLEEWKQAFSPWKLTWYTERKIEETFKGNAGLVMRFERRE